MAWIVEHPGGDVTQHAAEPGTSGVATGTRWALTPRTGDLRTETWDWELSAWACNLDGLRDKLCAAIDVERRRRGNALLTQGQSVNLGYARKGAETTDYFGMSSDALAALDSAARAARWPWLCAEVTAGGGTLAEVAARVRDSMDSSEATIRTIDARAVVAKRAVRAAMTEAAIRAAADINWET